MLTGSAERVPAFPLTSTLRSGRAIKATSMPPLATATEDKPALSLGERENRSAAICRMGNRRSGQSRMV